MAGGLNLKTLHDEYGNRWLIEAGDPGERALKVAKELRIRRPTLPSEICAGLSPAYPIWKPFEDAIDGGDLDELRALYIVNRIRSHLWNI